MIRCGRRARRRSASPRSSVEDVPPRLALEEQVLERVGVGDDVLLVGVHLIEQGGRRLRALHDLTPLIAKVERQAASVPRSGPIEVPPVEAPRSGRYAERASPTPSSPPASRRDVNLERGVRLALRPRLRELEHLHRLRGQDHPQVVYRRARVVNRHRDGHHGAGVVLGHVPLPHLVLFFCAASIC